MMTKSVLYVAVFRKEDGSCYGVDFPDFPGCTTAGDTLEEAWKNAPAALELHVRGLLQDGAEIPDPTPLRSIVECGVDNDVVSLTLVVLSTKRDTVLCQLGNLG